MKQISFENPISVSDYISVLNQLLSNVNVKIIGEVSEMKKAASGHVYFSLKDSKTNEIINCAIWKNIYNMYGVALEDGMEVVVSGSADIYGARGSLTFKVRTVERVGKGALKKAYEELKLSLAKQGFFEEERKRPIPKYPQKIGVITSLKGAAIHDFINNLGKFGFKVLLCDSRVEGQEAVPDILLSLKTMKRKKIDVLVIIRGGGSLQSLLAFDNETVVKEVVNFPVPVCTGIGHHEDVTLTALASDAHYSTPTAVANKLSENFQKAKEKIIFSQKKIDQSFYRLLATKKEIIYSNNEKIKEKFYYLLSKYKKKEEISTASIFSFPHNLKLKREKIKNVTKNILFSYKTLLAKEKIRINNYQKIISIHNPKRQLQLGYTITKKGSSIIKSVKGLSKNDTLETLFYDGKINSQITNINKKRYE